MPDSDRDIRSLASVILGRMSFMRQAGITFDGARDLYAIYGLDRVVTNKMYRDTYYRGGIAKRIVEAAPQATWRGGVKLQEDEDPEVTTEFEKAWIALETKFHIWSILQRVDILAGLGSYAVLLIGAPGELSDELPSGKFKDLLYFTPFAGGGGPGLHASGGMTGAGPTSSGYVDATIQEFESSAQSPRFGLPNTYQLRRLDVTSPEFQRPTHWSRVIHISEGLLDNSVYGVPSLECVWNLITQLETLVGAGVEAFFLRSNQGLHLDLNPDVSLSADAQAKLKDEVEEYKNNISRVLKTRGMSVQTLGSDVAQFATSVDCLVTLIAGAKHIPKRILLGSEEGKLASGQDADNWSTFVQDRRTSYVSPCIVRPLVDRLIEKGYLPEPKQYEVVWPTVEELTEIEKADGAAKWANTKTADGKPVFLRSEIRQKWYRLQPIDDAALAAESPAPAAPTGPDGAPGGPSPDPAPDPAVKAATASLLATLDAALLAGDRATVDAVLGFEHLDEEVVTALEAAIETGDADEVMRVLGGPGSGWTAENGHVPGATSGNSVVETELAPGYHVTVHPDTEKPGMFFVKVNSTRYTTPSQKTPEKALEAAKKLVAIRQQIDAKQGTQPKADLDSSIADAYFKNVKKSGNPNA